eukprot:SAG31_NODE_12094_length_969_cov_1.111494_3_plen_72_part_01
MTLFILAGLDSWWLEVTGCVIGALICFAVGFWAALRFVCAFAANMDHGAYSELLAHVSALRGDRFYDAHRGV